MLTTGLPRFGCSNGLVGKFSINMMLGNGVSMHYKWHTRFPLTKPCIPSLSSTVYTFARRKNPSEAIQPLKNAEDPSSKCGPKASPTISAITACALLLCISLWWLLGPRRDRNKITCTIILYDIMQSCSTAFLHGSLRRQGCAFNASLRVSSTKRLRTNCF